MIDNRKTIRILLLMCVFTSAFLLLTCGSALAKGELTYKDTKEGFELKYPKNVKIKKGLQGAAAVFLTQLEGGSDAFKENVNIVFEDLGDDAGISLDEYVKESIAGLSGTVSNLKVAGKEKITLGGAPAYKIVFTGTAKSGSKNGEFKFMQAYALRKGRGIIITYTAEAAGYDKFLYIMETIIKSFKFL